MKYLQCIDRLGKSRLLRKVAGFSVVGVIVTIVSLVLLYIFNELCHLNVYVSYIVAYVLSIALSYFLNSGYVFQAKFAWKKVIVYYLTYLSSMLLGVVVLWLYEFVFPSANHTLLSYMVIPVTTLYNYVFVSKILKCEKKR